MNIVITGHTNKLGKYLADYYQSRGDTVQGFSRTTGHDVNQDFDKIVEAASTCDLFINNVYANDIQAKFIKELYNKCPIITMGSIGADFYIIGNDYRRYKMFVEETHRVYRKTAPYPMLLLKPGYLENYPDKYPIAYSEILEAIKYWETNPTRVSLIELENDTRIYTGQ